MILEQQLQIDELKRATADRKSQESHVAGKPETSVAPAPSRGIGEIVSTAPILAPLPAMMALPGQDIPAKSAMPTAPADQPSPLQIHLGEATITPVGFMDITNTWRSTNAGTSLQTNFGSFPYNNTIAGRLREDKWSAENSRLGLRVDANVPSIWAGRVEAAFRRCLPPSLPTPPTTRGWIARSTMAALSPTCIRTSSGNS
jgi:hypothetical protein